MFFYESVRTLDPLIANLKQQDAVAEQERDTANRIRLHNADVIQAKAPDLWCLVINHIATLCGDMLRAFPYNSKRHPFLEPLVNGFILNGGGLPRRILAADLDIKGQRIRLSERIKNSLEDDPRPEIKPPVSITVGEQEELLFQFMGRTYDDPQDIARAMICHVCGISKSDWPVTSPSP